MSKRRRGSISRRDAIIFTATENEYVVMILIAIVPNEKKRTKRTYTRSYSIMDK